MIGKGAFITETRGGAGELRSRLAGVRLFAEALVVAVRAWMPVILFVAAYAVAVATQLPVGADDLLGFGRMIQMVEWLAIFAVAAFFAFIVFRLLSYAKEGLPPNPSRRLLREAKATILNPAGMISLIVLLPVVSLFMQAFGVAKGNMAYLNPFSWDETFMRLDRLLHGGIDPWRLLAPVASSPAATLVLNIIYILWFFVSTGTLFWVVLRRRPDELAIRYLLAVIMVWVIGGNVVATIFSSAGPVYYGRLGLSPDPYAPLMEYLRSLTDAIPVWALTAQEALWERYLAQNVELGGISAFPSIHNAQAALLALLAWKANRRLGWLATVYAALIAVGSVWLGWHYAVDAYAGIAIAAACWWLARPATRWMLRRPAMRRLGRLQRRLDPAP